MANKACRASAWFGWVDSRLDNPSCRTDNHHRESATLHSRGR